jgi:hypothetical protein
MRICVCWKAALTAGCALATIGPAAGAPPQVIEAADAAANDLFGRSVALDADTLVVGAYAEDDAGVSAGAVYVYRWDGADWVEEAKLTASDAGGGENFGYAVAIDGDTIVVGAWRENAGAGSDQGAAYVFTRSGTLWTEQDKLVAGDGASGDRFGVSVDVDGDLVIIGAHLHDGPAGNDQGAAYIFRRSGGAWSEQAKLLPSDAFVGAEFGFDVGVSNGTVVVGAPDGVRPFGVQQNLTLLGTAYIFTESGGVWMEDAAFGSSDAQAGERFGASVAIDGDRLIVGATDKLVGSNFDQGAAYIFERAVGVWSEQQKLVASDGASDDFFGTEVDLRGARAIVGSPFRDEPAGADHGAAYVFALDAGLWNEETRLDFFGADPGAEFGTGVAIDGAFAAVGAWLADGPAGATQGAAQVFERASDRWIMPDQTVPAPAPSQFGTSIAISNDTLVVGAPLEDIGAISSAGAVYVYRRDALTWRLEQRLTAESDARQDGLFGWSVALDGDELLVGSRFGIDTTTGYQQAFLFARTGSTWTREAVLSPSGTFDGLINFGWSVDIDGDTAVVGAITGLRAWVFRKVGSTWVEEGVLESVSTLLDNFFGWSVGVSGDTVIVSSDRAVGGADQRRFLGAVEVFRRNGGSWSREAELLPSDGTESNPLGRAVGIDGDLLVAGRPFDDARGEDAGAAYAFVRTNVTTWSQAAKFYASDASAGDEFGSSIALHGDFALVGAPYADGPGGPDQGAAYLFEQRNGRWVERAKLTRPAGSADENFGFGVALTGDTAAIGAPSLPSSAASEAAFTTDAAGDTLPPIAENINSGTTYDFLNDAVNDADAQDIIIASARAFSQSPTVATGDLALSMHSETGVRRPRGAELELGAGSTLSASADQGVTLFANAALAPGAAIRTGGGIVRNTRQFSAQYASVDGSLRNDRTGGVAIDGALTINGDLRNRGDVTLNGGSLIVSGSVNNNGQIDAGAPLRAGDAAVRAGADLVFQRGATLTPGAALVSARGAFDCAISDSSRFALADAELRMDGDGVQTLERMSTDIGPSPDGLDRTLPGHYPIDTLRIGPTSTTVDLVDAHDNDNLGQAACEAIYVRTLIIDAGATLNTNGCPVYYETLVLNGSVDDPANLIQIAQCPADLTGDGQVDGADLGLLLGSWGGAQGDLNGDGNTDGADLGLLLGAWGPCP